MEQPPLFVKIDEYKELTKVLSSVDDKLQEASTLLEELQRLKEEEDAQIAAWRDSLHDVKSRSEELRNTLYQ